MFTGAPTPEDPRPLIPIGRVFFVALPANEPAVSQLETSSSKGR
jgi:hypothetical protein